MDGNGSPTKGGYGVKSTDSWFESVECLNSSQTTFAFSDPARNAAIFVVMIFLLTTPTVWSRTSPPLN